MLRWLGHGRVARLDGGWAGWCAQNGPIDVSVTEHEPAPYPARSGGWISRPCVGLRGDVGRASRGHRDDNEGDDAMQLPLQVTYRDLTPSQAVTAKIREKADKLERFYDRITGCRVMIEAPHAHRHKGRIFHVRIALTVPDGELVVSRDHHDRPDYTDLYVAIRDAFDAAGRKLKAYARRRRGDVKAHDAQPNGHVPRITSECSYGAIGTDDGREIHFHRNGLLNGAFDALHVEVEVHYVEESGAQAGTVRTVRRRREA